MLIDKIKSGELPGTQIDWGAWAPDVSRQQICDFVDTVTLLTPMIPVACWLTCGISSGRFPTVVMRCWRANFELALADRPLDQIEDCGKPLWVLTGGHPGDQAVQNQVQVAHQDVAGDVVAHPPGLLLSTQPIDGCRG
jgi:hypothetical protein